MYMYMYVCRYLFHFEGLGCVHAEQSMVHAVGQLQPHQPRHSHVILPQVQVCDVLVLCQHLSQSYGTYSHQRDVSE